MPLRDGYGVLVGSLQNHFIDPPDDQGRWPHYHLKVDTGANLYDCAINLKSRTEIKVEYRDFRNVGAAAFSPVLGLGNGFHRLASTATSGALDVIRHNGLQNPVGLSFRLWPLRFGTVTYEVSRWWLESGLNLIKLMGYYLERVERVFVFGEPFRTGFGMHNIHMNQGDPVGSEFARENGIWQDGGVILKYSSPQPRLSVMVTKFQTQSLHTDDRGRPL